MARKCSCKQCGCKTTPINHVVLVLDESGSMSGIARQAENVVQNWVKKLKEENKKYNQVTRLSVINFGSTVFTSIRDINIEYANVFCNFGRRGNTALYDAVYEGIKLFDNKNFTPNESVLFIVITDGQENWSGTTSDTLGERLNRLERTNRYTFTFAMPAGDVAPFLRQFPYISKDNIQPWDNTEEGVKSLEVKTSGGIGNFYSARAAGQSCTRSFYTDLSGVTTNDLRRNLKDITSFCNVFDVNKEDNITHFIELKTKSPYVKGYAFYQLMKKEKVAANKEIVIMDKTTGKIYGGSEARELIGLQKGVDARVSPLDHGKYDIFIQSHSVNRILPRGTKVLVKSVFCV